MTFNTDEPIFYFGGCINTVRSTARYGVAAVNTSDSTLNAWDPTGGVKSSTFSGTPYVMVFDTDKIYIGGIFDTVGGIAKARVAAVNTSSPVLEFQSGTNNTVRSLAKDSSRVYIGGAFLQ